MHYGFTVKVKFQGPTNYKGARWHARVTRTGMMDALHPSVTVSASPQDSPSQGAHGAARQAMANLLGINEHSEAVAYGELSPSEYVFIF